MKTTTLISHGNALGSRAVGSNAAGFSRRAWWVAHVAFIELDVFFREVGIHQRAGFAEVEADVEIELLRGRSGTELLEGRLRWLAALGTQRIFRLPGAL